MDPIDNSDRRRIVMNVGAVALGAVMARGSSAAALQPSDGGGTAQLLSIAAQEFWTEKNGVRLWVYRKRVNTAAPAPNGLLFLVHGSSYSGKTMFDLSVPNRTDYSFMDHFARLGYDVWTMDHEGYGHSDRTKSNSDIASGAEDLKVAMALIRRETGQDRAAYFGQSSGALRAGLFANLYPQHVSKLMLDALVWTGKDAPTLAQRKKMLPQLQTSNVRKIDRAFYASVFTRDDPNAAERMLGDVVADAELKYGDTVPTGTYLDMVTKLPLVDPTRIQCPVLITRAEHDGIATDEDVMGFFERLPTSDKQFVKIGGLAHTAPLGINRHRFWHALHAFLSMPERRPAPV
ncbi:MAG: lysophospholipase [Pseudomonadota bacterium]|nr:lysophospholipase [Pseudomonadota bacterium]